jgi:hypothetical protein
MLLGLVQNALGGTCPFLTGVNPIEKELTALKLKFIGVQPTVIKKPSPDGKAKLVITKYSSEPTFETKDGILHVKAGSCTGAAGDATATVTGTTAAPATDSNVMSNETSSAWGSRPSILAMTVGTLAMVKRSPALGLSAGVLGAMSAEASETCDAAMEVEVHMTQADVDAYVCETHKTGQYRTCAAESVYVKFPKGVHGSYEGCAGDSGLIPCEQDGFGGMKTQISLQKPYEFDEATGTCTKTKFTFADEIFWILWGHPMDTHELLQRTGMNPVVYLPVGRGGYPSHGWGGSHGDEGLAAKTIDHDWLMYLGAFSKDELAGFTTTLTEGTEQGMGMLYAAMMTYIAQTSCNRKIYLLVEAPTYGYDMGSAVDLANKNYKSFMNHSSCSCFKDDLCKSDDKANKITLTRIGFFPGQELPKRNGDDGLPYDASSTDAKSPWFERMVWPENPTGEVRTQVGPESRLLCDGCYIFPPYFKGGEVPRASKPKCAGWAFSLTKIYSAQIRAGTLLTKTSHPFNAIMEEVAGDVHSMANGLYSEWVWHGSMQVKQLFMAKPYSDPKSWVGAYSALMAEKWTILVEAFKDCPVMELINGPDRTGAYLWLKKKPGYQCLNKGGRDSFMLDCIGVQTTSYNFGFRGTTASDYYGAGYCQDDFTRIQLYRDINVYKEVAKRLKTVCGGGAVTHALGTFMTLAEWKASKSSSRRLEEQGMEPKGVEEHKEHLKRAIPRFTDQEAQLHAEHQHEADEIDKKVEEHCAPRGYPMDCLFKHYGRNKPDIKIVAH